MIGIPVGQAIPNPRTISITFMDGKYESFQRIVMAEIQGDLLVMTRGNKRETRCFTFPLVNIRMIDRKGDPWEQ